MLFGGPFNCLQRWHQNWAGYAILTLTIPRWWQASNKVAQQGKHEFFDYKHGCPLGHARDNNPQQGKNEFILTRDASASQASELYLTSFALPPFFEALKRAEQAKYEICLTFYSQFLKASRAIHEVRRLGGDEKSQFRHNSAWNA